VIARKRLDIGWIDLATGIRSCLWPGSATEDDFRNDGSLHCLSVRSGFDLYLTALALPHGSEVLVSAVTIPDMPRILREHGLVPVPVDLDFATASVSAEALRAALTPETKAILVAHLFGSRMEMDPVIAFAREHGLIVIEDCAQAFVGKDFTGDPRSDLRMFSFGPIKTATALGGAVLFVNDAAIHQRMTAIQSGWPPQSKAAYLKKLLTFSVFKAALAPFPFAVLLFLLRVLGRDYDAFLTVSARSFPGEDFFFKIRHRPCLPLLRLVSRRIRTYPGSRLTQRTAAGLELLEAIPARLAFGGLAPDHTFWIFPVVCADREAWRKRLFLAGFDAVKSSTGMGPVDAPPERPGAITAISREAMKRVIYLPIYPEMSRRSRRRLAILVSELAEREWNQTEPLQTP
jgi:dTDP-4-amino-4,6-dideoxygalactose transaminase